MVIHIKHQTPQAELVRRLTVALRAGACASDAVHPPSSYASRLLRKYLFLALVFCARLLFGMSCLAGLRPPGCEIPLNLAFYKLVGMIIREALKTAVKHLYRITRVYRKLQFKSKPSFKVTLSALESFKHLKLYEEHKFYVQLVYSNILF